MCTFFVSPQCMTVVFGAHDITKPEKSQQRIQVAKHYPHPKFTGNFDYDIMLLQVNLNQFPLYNVVAAIISVSFSHHVLCRAKAAQGDFTYLHAAGEDVGLKGFT